MGGKEQSICRACQSRSQLPQFLLFFSSSIRFHINSTAKAETILAQPLLLFVYQCNVCLAQRGGDTRQAGAGQRRTGFHKKLAEKCSSLALGDKCLEIRLILYLRHCTDLFDPQGIRRHRGHILDKVECLGVKIG